MPNDSHPCRFFIVFGNPHAHHQPPPPIDAADGYIRIGVWPAYVDVVCNPYDLAAAIIAAAKAANIPPPPAQ